MGLQVPMNPFLCPSCGTWGSLGSSHPWKCDFVMHAVFFVFLIAFSSKKSALFNHGSSHILFCQLIYKVWFCLWWLYTPCLWCGCLLLISFGCRNHFLLSSVNCTTLLTQVDILQWQRIVLDQFLAPLSYCGNMLHSSSKFWVGFGIQFNVQLLCNLSDHLAIE